MRANYMVSFIGGLSMHNKLWPAIANGIANSPRLVGWIKRTSTRTPYMHLDGYMHRWWLLPRWCLQVDEYGYLFPKPWMPFAIRVHHIKRPDAGLDLHDHPFDYRTIIMDGWYRETNIFGASTLRFHGDTIKSRAQTFHHIDDMPSDGVWTLFIMGRRINAWGFLVGGRKVYYRDYLGKH